MVVSLPTCTRMKKIQSNMATILYVNFSDSLGQIILQSVVRSCRNMNSFKHICMSSIPAKMKKIESKMKALEWPQHFSIISL